MAINSNSSVSVTYMASASTITGGSWLKVSPGTGSTSSTAPGATTVSVTSGTLAAGVYTGSVSYQFSGAAVRTVNVTLIVAPTGTLTGTTGASPQFTTSLFKPDQTGPACTPAQLVPTQTGLVNNFAQPTSWPTPLSIQVVNNCAASIANGQVVATFSNGDPPLALGLVNAGTGLYSGTWTPRTISGQVAVTATVTAPGFSPQSPESRAKWSPMQRRSLPPEESCIYTIHKWAAHWGRARYCRSMDESRRRACGANGDPITYQTEWNVGNRRRHPGAPLLCKRWSDRRTVTSRAHARKQLPGGRER